MAAIAELNHEVETQKPIPEGVQIVLPHGEIYQLTGEEVNIFTLIEQDRRLKETARTVIALRNNPEGDEAWILPQEQKQQNVSNRIRFIDDGTIEFVHCNGTEPPLRAAYDVSSGKLHTESLQLVEGVEVTVPAYISPVAIQDIKNTFVTLKDPIPNSLGISALSGFAQSGNLLGVFAQNPEE